jgi:hypothetical protein
MNGRDASKTKLEFRHQLQRFADGLHSYTLTEDGQWSVKGFIDVFRNVYTISSDTKIVSKVLEIHLLPKILKFAEDVGCMVVLANYQNWYPDLSFVSKRDSSVKFAVDIKTSYRDPTHPGHCNGFTLGSHGTYFVNRSSKKNIQFPYNQYLGHYCMGIIYTRTDLEGKTPFAVYRVNELSKGVAEKKSETDVILVDALRSVVSVVEDFQFFICEKWEIASDKRGSGNTANIGSITSIEDILNCRGIFKNLGEKWFDDYWMNYGKITITDEKGKSKKLTNLADFVKYRGQDPKLIYPRTGKMKGK